jgi:hypothetical protein
MGIFDDDFDFYDDGPGSIDYSLAPSYSPPNNYGMDNDYQLGGDAQFYGNQGLNDLSDSPLNWLKKGGGVFGEGGIVDQYGPAAKMGAGVLDYLGGRSQQRAMNPLIQQQQRFAQGQGDASAYWDQQSRNASQGIGPQMNMAMAQAQQAKQRQLNKMGRGPTEQAMANEVSRTMAGTNLDYTRAYGDLARGFGANATGANTGSATLMKQGYGAGNEGVASLFGSLAQNIPQYRIVDGKLVKVDRDGNVIS